MALENMVGIVAGVLTALSLVPQLIKILKEKCSKDLSIPYLLVLLSGLGCWIWYGFLRGDVPVVATNITSALISLLTLIAGVHYKQGQNNRSIQ